MSLQATRTRRLRLGMPSLFMAVLTLANLAVLWWGVYKILPITQAVEALVLIGAFPPIARASLRRIAPAALALLAVYAYTGMATRWSPDPSASMIEFGLVVLAVTPALLFGYALGSRFSAEEVGMAFGVVPLLFLFQAVYNQLTSGDPMLLGEFSIRTILAGVICLTTPLLLAAWLQRPRAYIGTQFTLSFLLALFMQSRSALLIVGPAVLYVLYRHSRKAFFGALLLGAFAGLVAAAFNLEQLEGRFSGNNTSLDITDDVLEEAAKPVDDRVDFDRRLQAYVAAGLFLENPIRGAGYSSVLQTNQSEYGLDIVSHGFLPGTAGELGLLGLGTIGFFFFRLFQLGRSSTSIKGHGASTSRTGFWCGLTALSSFGFFHQTFESAFFGVVVGIAFGLAATAERTEGRLERAVRR